MWPVTQAVNKHLLPVFNKPMLHYSLSVLMVADIREVIVVTTPTDAEVFGHVLRDGSQWGLRIEIAVQQDPGGIVDCLNAAEGAHGRSAAVILGDNFFYGAHLADMLMRVCPSEGATIFTTFVEQPQAFAVVSRSASDHPTDIVEKPVAPASNEAVTGLYFYPDDWSDRIQSIGPSHRGEREITDLNRSYLRDGAVTVERLPRGTTWFDCGSHLDLLRASTLVRDLESLGGSRISCLEEIAWRRQWISKKQLRATISQVPDPTLARYLENLISETGR